MISIREYTKERGISYEAGRKCLRRYEESLKGHLISDGRSVLLDDDAVKFLDERRSMKKGKGEPKQPRNPQAYAKRNSKVQTRHESAAPTESLPGNASEIEMENRLLRERIESLSAALKREEEKAVKLETEHVRMMSNTWDNPSKTDILVTGGYLTRHHYAALERYETPSLEGMTDVFCVFPLKDGKYKAGYVTVDVTELDRNGSYDRKKVLKKIGRNAEDTQPVLFIASGQVLAEAIVMLYGPAFCGGTAYDGTPLTGKNEVVAEKEVMKWMEDIGAEEYLPEKERSTYLGSRV